MKNKLYYVGITLGLINIGFGAIICIIGLLFGLFGNDYRLFIESSMITIYFSIIGYIFIELGKSEKQQQYQD